MAQTKSGQYANGERAASKAVGPQGLEGSIPLLSAHKGNLAQLVEHSVEARSVPGSSPGVAT